MSVLDDIKAKADANGDGKLDASDLEGFKDKMPADKFDELKSKLDASGDGKLSFDDIQGLDWSGLIDNIKNSFGSGLFNK